MALRTFPIEIDELTLEGLRDYIASGIEEIEDDPNVLAGAVASLQRTLDQIDAAIEQLHDNNPER